MPSVRTPSRRRHFRINAAPYQCRSIWPESIFLELDTKHHPKDYSMGASRHHEPHTGAELDAGMAAALNACRLPIPSRGPRPAAGILVACAAFFAVFLAVFLGATERADA